MERYFNRTEWFYASIAFFLMKSFAPNSNTNLIKNTVIDKNK